MLEFLEKYWLLSIVIAIASAAAIEFCKRTRRYYRFQAAIKDRDPLSSDQFADEFFAETAERRWVAEKLHRFLAGKTHVDFSRVRPTDRLSEMELTICSGPGMHWDLQDEFEVHLEGHDIDRIEELSQRIETVADLVDELIEAKYKPWPIDQASPACLLDR